MTINGTNIDQYLLQEVSTGFEYRNGDSGFTANGSHYQNILAKKVVLSLPFRPLKLTEYQTIKNLFYSILKEDKNNSENIYDWDIGNKTLNTITTSNTSQKAFLLKDKEKEKQRQRDKKENRNNNFIDIQNIFNKNINEFEECFNKPKNDRIVGNKFWSNTKNTNERFYHSQIIQHSDTKKNINTEGNTYNKGKNILKKEENNINDEDIIDLEYQNIMELTEEGKDNDINKCPNVSGLIHSKNQIEKNNSRKLKDKSECIIF